MGFIDWREKALRAEAEAQSFRTALRIAHDANKMTEAERDQLRALLQEAHKALVGVDVFVKSREQIKKPEGHQWFDEVVARIDAALKGTP